MGRKPKFDVEQEPVTVYLPKGSRERIDATLARTESRSDFVRESVERELSRRSRKTAKKETGDNGNA